MLVDHLCKCRCYFYENYENRIEEDGDLFHFFFLKHYNMQFVVWIFCTNHLHSSIFSHIHSRVL